MGKIEETIPLFIAVFFGSNLEGLDEMKTGNL